MEMKHRERHIDVSNLSIEEADQLSGQIGGKVREMVDETVEKVNRLLGIYGLKAKMQIVIEENTEKTSNL